jgi:hypothetical protein
MAPLQAVQSSFFEGLDTNNWDFCFCVQTKALKFEENVSKKFGWDFSAVPEDEAPVLVTSIFEENME